MLQSALAGKVRLARILLVGLGLNAGVLVHYSAPWRNGVYPELAAHPSRAAHQCLRDLPFIGSTIFG